MSSSFAKIVGSTIALLVLGSICILGVRAQQNTGNGASIVSTNWIGYLVTGQSDAFDRITPGPSPTIIRQVEIGLRSDGVVIWREAPKNK